MSRFTYVALLSSVVLLTACNPLTFFRAAPPDTAPIMQKEEGMMKEDGPPAADADAMMKKNVGMMSSEQPVAPAEEKAMSKRGVYVGYQDGVIGNGETSVLFSTRRGAESAKKPMRT